MIDLFGSLRAAIKRREIVTDNPVFRLHYLFTSILLIAFSLMVTARQYFGNPIDCMMHKDNIQYIDVYCWIHSTFTMPQAHDKTIGKEVAHPGIQNSAGEEMKYYAYYQWVCFVLFFQAALFYIPRWLWKMWEGGLMDTIVLGMHIGIMTEEDKNNKKGVLVDYLIRNAGRHTMYAIRYFIAEVLCLVNVIGQMYLMNRFLGGEFFDYGTRVLAYSEMNQFERADPMVYVFPRMTKCRFHKFGPSGDITRHDALCILPLNIVNEKIYIFIWFWFIILAILSSIVILYRLFIIAFPRYRLNILRTRARLADPNNLRSILRIANIGDWYLLYTLAKNIDPVVYREVVDDLSRKIETADSNNPEVSSKML